MLLSSAFMCLKASYHIHGMSTTCHVRGDSAWRILAYKYRAPWTYNPLLQFRFWIFPLWNDTDGWSIDYCSFVLKCIWKIICSISCNGQVYGVSDVMLSLQQQKESHIHNGVDAAASLCQHLRFHYGIIHERLAKEEMWSIMEGPILN